MATLITVPRGMTVFKGYDKPRMTKSKSTIAKYSAKYCPSRNEICSNCKQREGSHTGVACPPYQIMKFD